MKPEQLDELFVPFTQADASTTRRFGGTGLGLSISSRLIELMDGTLKAESAEGVGSRFFFTIPFEAEKDENLPVNIEELQILIIDPQQNSREVLREYIASVRGVPTVAEDGTKALDHLARQNFDLLIIAEELPDISAHELQQQFTGPVIILTPQGKKRDSVISAEEKDVIISKPVGHNSLIQALQLALHGTTNTADKREKVRFAPAEILVVEDNMVNQQVAEALLNEAGLSVSLADNGEEALQLLTKKRFDLVFMDIQMPVLDGFATTREIRLQPQWQELPIIAMTAYATHEECKEIISTGMNAHLAKPIEVNELIAVLKNWLPLANRGEEEQEAATVAIPHQSILNIEAALPRFADNEKKFHQALCSTVASYTDCAGELSALLAEKQLDKARILVHTMRGEMGTVGAEALFAICTELEKRITREKLDNIDGLLGELALAIEQFAACVQELSKTKESSVEPAVSPAATLAIIDELLTALQLRRPLDCSKTMEQLLKIEGVTKSYPEITRLSSLIDNYEFAKALDLAAELHKEMKQAH